VRIPKHLESFPEVSPDYWVWTILNQRAPSFCLTAVCETNERDTHSVHAGQSLWVCRWGTFWVRRGINHMLEQARSSMVYQHINLRRSFTHLKRSNCLQSSRSVVRMGCARWCIVMHQYVGLCTIMHYMIHQYAQLCTARNTLDIGKTDALLGCLSGAWS
jgi:hypothetical protein